MGIKISNKNFLSNTALKQPFGVGGPKKSTTLSFSKIDIKYENKYAEKIVENIIGEYKDDD